MSLFSTFLDILFPREAAEERVLTLSESDLAQYLHIQSVNGVRTLFPYRKPIIKKMVWMLKYKGDSHVVQLFAHALADTLLEDIADTEMFNGITPYTIIPLPLSGKRERERGFNQMKLIGAKLSELTNIPLNSKLLEKTRHTEPQTSLSRSRRMTNSSCVFSVVGILDKKTTYIIIDDVVTTGSTLAEAQKVLRLAGAEKILPIALAH